MNNFDTFSNRVQNVLDFISKLFSDGHNYSQINTTSSALSSIITIRYPVENIKMLKGFWKTFSNFNQYFPSIIWYGMLEKSLITLETCQ